MSGQRKPLHRSNASLTLDLYGRIFQEKTKCRPYVRELFQQKIEWQPNASKKFSEKSFARTEMMEIWEWQRNALGNFAMAAEHGVKIQLGRAMRHENLRWQY